MNILALDFDGVICSSRREVYRVARRAYADMMPLSPMAASVQPDLDADPVYARFTDLLPLGNRAEDFGVALKAIDENASIADQNGYDHYRARQSEDWCSRFHQAFYGQRRTLRASHPGAWAALHDPFPLFHDALGRLAMSSVLGIVTAKDRLSVWILLDLFGIGHLFTEDRVLDKETGVEKTAHLKALAERCRAPFKAVVFVDDKVNHLQHAAGLGVRCVLAGWGDNTAREHRMARSLGFAVATLETAEAVIRDQFRQ